MNVKQRVNSDLCRVVVSLIAFALFAFHGSAQQSSQKLSRHIPLVVSNRQAALVRALPSSQAVRFTIVLSLRNQAALKSLLAELYDPSSPRYRHFLNVQEFTDQFGPTAQDYESVIKWAADNGLNVDGQSTNRLVVDISGTVGQVNSALGVSMNEYRDPKENRTFFSNDREPSLNLNVPIAHIEGLNNFSVPRPMVKLTKNSGPVADVTGSGPGGYYLGSDIRAAYYGGSLLTGAGQCVGLFEFGGYRLSDVNLTFSNAGQTYGVPINNVLIDGATSAAGADDSEQVLDIVQAIGMAPGLSQVRVYIGTTGRDADIFNSMATENTCKQLAASWSWAPDDPATDDPIFQEFATQGQSIFVASGDDGAYDPAISPYFYPAEDAFVTSVGATHLNTNYGGGPWVSESTWNNPPYGSGGGISPDSIAIPSWQQGIATYSNGGSTYFRNVPDVAMEGDQDNFYCNLGTCAGGAGGTSFAAPRWAAFMALVNEQATEVGTAPSGGLGFINPAIYSIGKGANYNTDLHDTTVGNNNSDNQPVWYNAIIGYDLVTGWGSPNGQSLIDALAGPVVSGFWLSSSPGSFAIAQGSSGTTTISVTDAGGFAGNVSLTVSGLPSGVSASFNPTSTSGTSVLTLTASSSATIGAASITITGTSGSRTSKTSVFINVNSPVASPPPVGSFGSVNVGTGSNPTPISVTFSTAGTLGSISVLTQGVANLDFANGGGGTCSIGTAYAINVTCTINVIFNARYSGTRKGAVVLADSGGNRLGRVYLQGSGVGPQTTFTPGKQTTIGSGFLFPASIAMTGDGSAYITDYGTGSNGAVYYERLSNGTYTQSTLNCTFKTPVGVAVDGSGAIYVADPGVPNVYKLVIAANGSCSQTAIGSGFGKPWGVAVDGNGDVYISDLGTSSISAGVYKETLQTNGGYLQSTVGSGWVAPVAVAVDGNGNIDVADYSIPGVLKETPSGGSYTQSAVGEGWTAPSAIAVDGNANIYVADAGNSIIYGGTVPAGVYKETVSGGGYIQTSIGSGWAVPYGLATEGSGNVYVADQTRGVFKNDLADPPLLSFANATTGAVSSDSPKTISVANLGNAGLQFSFVSYPTDFPEATGVSTDCTSSSLLNAGANCTLSIEFLPATPLGTNTSLPLSEYVSITTNTLNAAGSQQTVAVTGTEVLTTGAVLLSLSPDPAAAGTPITFTATVTTSSGRPTPTGTITFYNGVTPISSPTSLTNGVATYTTSSLTIGTYSASASYSGDANYLASNSNSITEAVISAPGVLTFGNTTIGMLSIGSTSNAIPLSITFNTSETLGGISVLTGGVPNLDFTNASGGTCVIGTMYAANTSCTVNVSFMPKYSGTRLGAVVLTDNNGSVIGTGYLEGTGVGPQTIFVPGTLTPVANGFGYPQGVAVDGGGNLYVADASGSHVYKETLSNGIYTQSTIGSSFNQPYGIAVDGAGNIYVTDIGSHAVYRETPSNGTYVQTVIGYGFAWPAGVAVDALGNVFVADFGNGTSPGSIYVETLSNGSYTQSTIGSGLVSPQAVAVDGSGNIYVADSGNGNQTASVYKLTPANGSYSQSTIGTGWITPNGLAVDGNGNVYVTDNGFGIGGGLVAKELLQSDGTYIHNTLLTSSSTPFPASVVVDGRGNLYVTDNFDGVLYRDDLADPTSLSFASTMFGSTSSDSPKVVTVQNGGNANLTFSGVSYPADFPEQSGIAGDCLSTSMLGAGMTCSLTIDFTPASLNVNNQPINLNESVSITSNNLNASGTVQTFATSGTEVSPQATIGLTVPANIATVGSSIVLMATVRGPSGVPVPNGSVTFYSNGGVLGTTPLNNGVASYSTSSLVVGSYSLTATYSGNQVYPSVTSATVYEQIIPASTFGTQGIGSTITNTITVTFSARVTLGSIAVLTQGTPNLDFTNAGGGTCTIGNTYSSGGTCTIKVAFNPRYSGTRYGAIVLGTNKSALIQMIYLKGTGVGPQITFLPGSQSTVANIPNINCGGTIDSNGNFYLTNTACTSVIKYTLSNGTYSQSTLLTTTASIGDLAIDGAGNIYITDRNNGKILKETLFGGSYSQSTISTTGSGWRFPKAGVVDGNGNVYFIAQSTGTGSPYKIFKETLTSSGTYTQSVVPTRSLYGPDKLAVDGLGNLYLDDYVFYIGGGTTHIIAWLIKETLSGSSYVDSTVETSTDQGTYTFNIDGNGNIQYFLQGQVFQATPSGTGYNTVAVIDVNAPEGIWSDGARNIYIFNGSQLNKVDVADPPTMNFASTVVGATSSDSPRVVEIQNVGSAILTFPPPGTGTNPSVASNFSLNSQATTCPQISTSSSAGSLIANSSCKYGINFVPATTGTINGSLVMSDNAGSGTQTIQLSGTGTSGGGNGFALVALAPGPGGTPQGVMLPNLTSAASANYSKIWVDTVHQTLIQGFVFLQVNGQGQTTCNLYSQANITPGPMPHYGALYYATENYALGGGQCPGILFPFRVARYSWGDIRSVEQDPFVLQVRDQYGVYLNEYGFTSELSHPIVENGCLKGGVVNGASQPIRNSVRSTLTLDNPPAGVTSYKWKIDGGNNAIVFTNGQQTIETTTPSATVKYLNVAGGGYQANLSVKIASSRNPGELDYGPLSYISCAAILSGSVPMPNPAGGPLIDAVFTPKYGYTLAQAEKICGYFNFDWQQTVTLTARPQPSSFAAANNPNVILYAPYNDPPLSGWVYQNPPNAVKIPVYYNLYTNGDSLALDYHENETTLDFFDNPTNPCLPGGTGRYCGGQTAPPGSQDGYTTHLVGIQGSLQNPYVCDTGIGFSWTSTYNGTSGGIAVKQSTQPVDPGSGTGGISVTAFSDSPPSSSVPMLLEQDQFLVTISALGTTSAVVTLTNIGGVPIDGPFQIVFDSLTPGVVLTNASGTFGGWSYLTVPSLVSLAPRKSASIVVQFSNPLNQAIGFSPIAYSGDMD